MCGVLFIRSTAPRTVDVGTAIHLENCKVGEAKQKLLADELVSAIEASTVSFSRSPAQFAVALYIIGQKTT
jgi:hypothetical protein